MSPSFTTTPIGPDKDAYYHELFLRSKRSLANQIPRTSVKGQGPRRPSSSEDEPNFYVMEYLPADPASSGAPLQPQAPLRALPPPTIATLDGTDTTRSDSLTRDWESKPQHNHHHAPLATIDSMSNMYVQGNPLSHWSNRSGGPPLSLHLHSSTTMAQALDTALQNSTSMAPPKTHILAAAAANVLGHAPLLPAQIIQPQTPPPPPPPEPLRRTAATHVSAPTALERPSSSFLAIHQSPVASKSPWKTLPQPPHQLPGQIMEHSESPWPFHDPPR
jgi:hypothetical protein